MSVFQYTRLWLLRGEVPDRAAGARTKWSTEVQKRMLSPLRFKTPQKKPPKFRETTPPREKKEQKLRRKTENKREMLGPPFSTPLLQCTRPSCPNPLAPPPPPTHLAPTYLAPHPSGPSLFQGLGPSPPTFTLPPPLSPKKVIFLRFFVCHFLIFFMFLPLSPHSPGRGNIFSLFFLR